MEVNIVKKYRTLFLCCILTLILTGTDAFYFRTGYEHLYTYTSHTRVFDVNNLTTIVKFRLQSLNKTADGGSLISLQMDSLVQKTGTHVQNNPKKWDFNKRFLFHMSEEGLVDDVHHYPDEDEEVLMLKKVLVSTMSAKAKTTDSRSSKFVNQEVDHAGHFDHHYHVYRTLEGLHVVKSHQSVDKVHRSHNKTMKYSHSGTLRFVAAQDSVTLKDQLVKDGSERQLLEHEMDINDTSTGDMPVITTSSRVQVKLEKIRKSSTPVLMNTNHLIRDSVLVKPRSREIRNKNMSEVNTDIQEQLQCIMSSADHYSSKRLECVQSLRELLSSLTIEDYQRLSEVELSSDCQQKDTRCRDRRNLFIDILSQEEEPSIQALIIQHFLTNENVNQTDLQRVLFQCIALRSPTLELLFSVKDLCFGRNNSLFFSSMLTHIQKKACLSLGALVNTVKNLHVQAVDDIVSKFEAWLSIHNETHSNVIVQPRKKRAVDEFDQVRNDHIVLNMVLIHAIGNAGMSRSLPYILSYMEPNKGHSSWRLAAIHALRSQSCNESAAALVTSMVEDNNRVVRDTALSIYKDHPLSKGGHNREHKDWVLRKSYNYPTLMRLKRGLNDGIHFEIRIPGVQWKKTIGNSAFGAEFGLTIRNGIEIEIKFLSGYAEVDIYDEAYVQVILGWFGIRQDLFKAKLCYQGHVSYDLNILKDFGIESLQDLAHIFDRVFNSIVAPIKDAVDRFKQVVQVFQGGLNLQDILNNLVELAKNLPQILQGIAKNLIDNILKSLEYSGAPWIRQVQKIVLKVRYFIEDIQEEVLWFYNTIADAVTVVLPYIGQKLFDSVASIIASFKDFLKNPVQSIFGIGKAVLDIKLAVGMFLDVKDRVLEVISSLTGKAPFWMNYGEDLSEIIEDVKDLFELISSQQGQATSQLYANVSTALTDGINDVREQKDIIIQEIQAAFGNLLNLVQNTLNGIGKPFLDAFNSVMDIIKAVKSSYENLRNVIVKVKSLVQKIFGPKFHIKFPARRRDEISGCGKGVWPTTTNGKYETKGVDVRAQSGKNIVCPVSGLARLGSSSNQIILEPKDDDFMDLEVIIDNVIPDSAITSDGVYRKAGEDSLGNAGQSPCQPNFIHVAVRKVTGEDGDSYEYVDPSMYLDRLVPNPQWIEECKERTFWHIGMAVDADTLGEAADRLESELERVSISSGFENDVPEIEPNYRPPGMDLVDHNDPASHQAWDDFKKRLKSSLSAFKDIGKQLFDFSSDRKGFNILDYVNINGYTLKMVKELVDKSVSAELEIVYNKLAELQNAVAVQKLEGLSMTKMRQFLKFAFNTNTHGDKSRMISRILATSEEKCPEFQGHIIKGEGHVCFAHPDCRGLTCGINLEHGFFQMMSEVDIRINRCTKQLNITTPVTTETILDLSIAGDFEHLVNISTKDTMTALLTISGYSDYDYSVFSAHAQLCVEQYESCLPKIEVLADIEMGTSGSCSDAAADSGSGIDEEMTIEEFLSMLSAYHLLDKKVLDAVFTLREAALQEILDDPRILLKVLGKEFKNRIDFCEDVTIPFPTKDIIIFHHEFFMMVGPVPMVFDVGSSAAFGIHIKFGLCFLSCSANVVVTPWAGVKVWAGARVEFFIFRAGIQLVGYVLDTRFPITGTIKFNKLPLGVVGKMDLVLVPVRLKLIAYVEFGIRICFWGCIRITITVFRGTLWEYRAPAISANMFTIPEKDEDKTPPQFVPNTIADNSDVTNTGSSSSVTGCSLIQVPGRDPTDTAFKIEATTSDDDSDVKLYFAIGTQAGGRNVMEWTDMGGALLVYDADLPNGVPLYWTLKAVNSQGQETYSSCHLDTYDNTTPDGRVDPSYIYSSHPHKISGTIRVFDDSPLNRTQLKALGYSYGQQGHEVVPFESFELEKSTARDEINTDLKYFAEPKEGKLTTATFETHIKERPADCATVCVQYGIKCVAFDYDYFTEKCELQAFVEGPSAKLRISGTYRHYERLGIGHSVFVMYDNLSLQHGRLYYINAWITNVLGYSSFLTSTGTMVDFTPPEPGPLGPDYTETYRADNCTASIDQRCKEVTWKDNHRIIHDGPGSSTVFNGHKPMEDMLYTRANHFASVNFDGFVDKESGIYGYMWSVGTGQCQQDIVSFQNPHEFLHSSKHWTHSGYQNKLALQDGHYYCTVQALNNVVFGGSLVTTLCHTTPFTVDTTPPDFGGVTHVYFDEDFDMLGVYYNASDSLSPLKSVDFGLGKTKYDVLVRRYSYHLPLDIPDPYLVVEELGLPPGVPAWIRIRPVNWVGLFRAGYGNEPILIDRTAPIPGQVLDGAIIRHDAKYQSDNKDICAQWRNFYDPESGVNNFMWGVGTEPEMDDVVAFHNYSHSQRYACVSVQLQHNTTYYSTVVVFNDAMNSKESNSSSNGVLIDITPPEPGTVHDGKSLGTDIDFSSESASKHSYWDNFTDPESGIDRYEVSVIINNSPIKTFEADKETSFTDHSITMHHADQVKFQVEAYNGAGLSVAVKSDGFLVDHTPPEMDLIRDSVSGNRYQSSKDSLTPSWQFSDQESGIKEYRYFIYEQRHGLKSRIWPKNSKYEVMTATSSNQAETVTLNNLSLMDGGTYSVHVTAINHALLPSVHESRGVIVDSTPPVMTKVLIALPGDEEQLDAQGNVEHVDPEGITVSWSGLDMESGISEFYVAIGTSEGDNSVTGQFIDMGKAQSAYITAQMEVYSVSSQLYHVTVKAKNGAGLMSSNIYSKPIIILRANIPGVIFDGREKYTDEDKIRDIASVAMSFHGFESESCNIISYEWAIGSTAFYSDIMPYTEYGIVHNDTHGHAEINIDLKEERLYYTTVRAKTGHNCHEDYIVSSSDGIKSDATKPKVSGIAPVDDDGHYVELTDAIYSKIDDSVDISWNISDQSEVSVKFSISRYPFCDEIHSVTPIDDNRLLPGFISPTPGESFFLNLFLKDEVGNENRAASKSITADITPPTIKNLTCSRSLSTKSYVLSCSWQSEELESRMKSLSVRVGSSALSDDLKSATALSTSQNKWSSDVSQILSSYTQTSTLHVTLLSTNVVNLEETYTQEVTIDTTPPSGGTLEIITWTDPTAEHTNQHCQIPWTYVDVRVSGFSDSDSGIDRAEVCLGTTPWSDDIKPFQTVGDMTHIFIGDISVSAGTSLYATLRIYNTVGLYSMITSAEVVVSPSPTLSVIDGAGDVDIDYQSDLNVLQGSWDYSDNCQILKAEWSVVNLRGDVVQDYITVPGDNDKFFYNDQLQLTNGFMYIIKVRTTDALNRTMEVKSDGITILIQPPFPARVRDGLGSEDVDYQEPLTELYANWDDFGEKNSDDPTQIIDHYEVSIGDDNRDEITRVNIHYFTNVGLNTSHTFRGLNLTAKTVRYYITVRAYSITGVYSEEYSNGVRAGYRLEIARGTLDIEPAQSSTNSTSFSWSGFESDIGLEGYKVAISTAVVLDTNETFRCSEIDNLMSNFDVLPPKSVNLDTLVNLENLTLEHGEVYYPCVITWDQIGMCAAVTGHPILVDTTPPNVTSAEVVLNDWNTKGKAFVYVNRETELSVELLKLFDPESGLKHLKFSLYKLGGCPIGNINQNTKVLIAEEVVLDDTKVTFYAVTLETSQYYYIQVEAVNTADLSTVLSGPVLLVDMSPPYSGTVKIGQDWYTPAEFQSSTTNITAWTAIARTEMDYNCPHVQQIFPVQGVVSFTPLQGEYSPEFVELTSSGATLNIGYNTALTKFLKGGIRSTQLNLTQGSYSVRLQSATGNNVITTFSLSSIDNFLSHDFSPPNPNPFADAVFSTAYNGSTTTAAAAENSSLPWNSSAVDNTTETSTASSVPVTTTLPVTSTTPVNNTTVSGISAIGSDSSYGCGVHILGKKQNGSTKWDGLFWAYDKNKKFEDWFTLEDDPSSSLKDYTIDAANETSAFGMQWNFELKVNGKTKAMISGMQFPDNMYVHIQTWTQDDYVEPLVDVFHPFRSEVEVSEVNIPLDTHKPCLEGKGFYDGESGITELWVGVSDSLDTVDNIKNYSLYKSFCIPCKNGCEFGCDPNCSTINTGKDFEQIPVAIHDLMLKPTLTSGDGLNATEVNEILNTTSYFVNIKVVTLAGQEVISTSNPVMVDATPPLCEYITCTDPENTGLDQPADYLGSNKTIGAYWSCEDNLSKVTRYAVSVGTRSDDASLYPETDFGTQSKVRVDLESGVHFSHGETYYVNMRVMNSAGLWNNYSCHVRAQLIPPDVSDTTPRTLFVDTSGIQISGVQVITYLDRIGMTWNSSNDDAQFYEWAIGTTPGGEDILPSIIVGNQREGSVSIIQGELWFGNNRTNQSILEFITNSYPNVTGGTLSFLFRMTPGQCLYSTLYAVGLSNLRSAIKSEPVCLTRPEDVRHSFENSSLFAVHVIGDSTGNFQESGGSTGDSVVAMNVTSVAGGTGGLVIGLLFDEDLDQQYGSATSTNFVSFVSDPRDTSGQTNRYLSGRIIAYLGLSVYISPAPTLEVDRIRLAIKINTTDFDGDGVPALVLWNSQEDDGIWIHVQEECGYDPATPVIEDGHYIVEICLAALQAQTTRSKRSTGVTITSPFQVSLVSMNSTYYNTPPVIDTSVVTCQEDHAITGYVIQWHDDESDPIMFSMGVPPANGTANVTSDGVLYYKPDTNYHGLDSVEIIVTENTTTAASISKSIVINVTNENDPPLSGYVYNDTVYATIDNKTLVLLFDGNQTDQYLIDYVVGDIDSEDSLSVITSVTNVNDVTFAMTEYHPPTLPYGLFSDVEISTFRKFKVDMSVSKDFYGSFQYYALGHDLESFYTERLEILVYIMWAPCVQGHCVPRSNESESCNHIIRSTTFDPYMCECDAGFTGTWCEVDIDDCASSPCGALYDCVDKPNYYECTVNAGMLSAVLLSLVLGVGILVASLIIWRKWQINKKKIRNMPFNDVYDNEKKPVFGRPYRECSEGHAQRPFHDDWEDQPSTSGQNLNYEQFDNPAYEGKNVLIPDPQYLKSQGEEWGDKGAPDPCLPDEPPFHPKSLDMTWEQFGASPPPAYSEVDLEKKRALVDISPDTDALPERYDLSYLRHFIISTKETISQQLPDLTGDLLPGNDNLIDIETYSDPSFPINKPLMSAAECLETKHSTVAQESPWQDKYRHEETRGSEVGQPTNSHDGDLDGQEYYYSSDETSNQALQEVGKPRLYKGNKKRLRQVLNRKEKAAQNLKTFFKKNQTTTGSYNVESAARNTRADVASGMTAKSNPASLTGSSAFTNQGFVYSHDELVKSQKMSEGNQSERVIVSGTSREAGRIPSAGSDRTSTPIGSETFSASSVTGIEI